MIRQRLSMGPRQLVSLAANIAFAASAAVAGAPPPPAAAADAKNGQILYQSKCGGCHSLDANRVGPLHRGVVGRPAGTAPGYNYSPALKRSGIVWSAAKLDRWLISPIKFVPGTRMGFSVSDARQRADIIAWLAANSPPQRNRK